MLDVEAILQVVGHRPWPLPRRPWVMTQAWNRLLFLHYRLPVSEVQPLIPPGLSLDTWEGDAWVSVTPFCLTDLRVRLLPPIPGLSAFPELNVRTYVTRDGKPGVFFFSLDAGSLSAVWGARIGYGLPYFWARMHTAVEGQAVTYRSQRRVPPGASFEGRYWPTGAVREAQPGELDYFLAERYCLYAVRGRRVYRAEIHHRPWPLQPAEAEIQTNSMVAAAGITTPRPAPFARYAERLKVLVWPLERCA